AVRSGFRLVHRRERALVIAFGRKFLRLLQRFADRGADGSGFGRTDHISVTGKTIQADGGRSEEKRNRKRAKLTRNHLSRDLIPNSKRGLVRRCPPLCRPS